MSKRRCLPFIKPTRRIPVRKNPNRRIKKAENRGKINEKRVLEALRRFPRPSWVSKIRHSDDKEDRFEGKDIVILTNIIGAIFLQVKSSIRGAHKFKVGRHGSNPRIEVIVVFDFEPPEVIAERAWRILGGIFHRFLLSAEKQTEGQAA